MTTAGTEEKATVREVYRLVGEVEARLGEKIDGVSSTLAAKLEELKDGTLQRVATLETQRVEDRHDIDELQKDMSVLKTAHALATGHIGAWKVVGGVFGGAAAIVIADLVFKAFGG